jgi:hypothetical protein
VDFEFPLNPVPYVMEMDADAFSAGKLECWNQNRMPAAPITSAARRSPLESLGFSSSNRQMGDLAFCNLNLALGDVDVIATDGHPRRQRLKL